MKISMRLLQNIIKRQEINTIHIFRNFSTKAIEFIDHATDATNAVYQSGKKTD